MMDDIEAVKAHYEQRIRLLLDRWRKSCLDRAWPTTEIRTDSERLPTRHLVYWWGFDVGVSSDRTAHVSIALETETDPTDDQGFVTVLHCFSSVTFGSKGSDYVAWDLPKVTELLGDDEGFERGFGLLEQVNGEWVADALNKRTVH